MKRVIALTLFAVCSVAPLHAELKYVMKMDARPLTAPAPPSTNPMLAMLGGLIIGTIVPPGGIQMTVIVGERGTRIEYDRAYVMTPAGGVMLFRPDGSAVVMNPADKTYWKIAKANAGIMGGALTPTVKMTHTDDIATIAGIRAERSMMDIRVALPVDASGMQAIPGMPSELNVSGEVWMAPSYARYAKLMPQMASGLGALGADKIYADGFPMRSIVRSELFGTQEIESIVTSVTEANVPATLFDVPADYTEVQQPPISAFGPTPR